MNKYVVPSSLHGERLDKILVSFVKDRSRNHLIYLINDGCVTVNGEEINKPAARMKENDTIVVTFLEAEDLEVKKENIPLDIIYEDSDIVVINKAPGMVVHPANGHRSGTLVNALLFHCHDLSGINGVKRPGIVHRIDKDTSGLLVACKNDYAHEEIAKQLMDKTMNREYYALVKGIISENNGKIIAPIGRDPSDRLKMAVNKKEGKEAITFFRVVQRYNQYTLITCKLTTGRTHQIRVHMAFIGHAIEGDPLYGPRKHELYQEGQLLHAFRLTLIHPQTKKEMVFEASLPQYFTSILKKLEQKD